MKIFFNYNALLLCALLLAACHKDMNSYDYSTIEEIEVNGIAESYNAVSNVDVLKIAPEVSSNLPDAHFEHTWTVYENNAQGYIPTVDTLSREKNLEFAVTLPAKSYTLVHIVTNKTTGLSKYTNVTLHVNTEYTRGWYVLKDDGTSSDLDQFITDGSIIPGNRKNENIYSFINGEKLTGKGTRLTFLNNYRSTAESATPINTRTLFVGTEKDMAAVFINTLEAIRRAGTLFFGGSSVETKDMVAFISSSTINLMNNNRVYGIYAMTPNSGIFGTYAMRDDKNSAYSLSPYFFTTSNSYPYLFDNTSSSFVTSVMAGPVLTNITDDGDTQMPAQRNNKKALYLGYQKDEYDPVNYKFLAKGWGLFEDKDDPTLRILTYLEPDGYKMKMTCDTLRMEDRLFHASLHTLLVGAENLMYFVHDGQVYSRNLSNGNERQQFVVPGGEEVTFIRHRKYSETGYAFDYLMVGTKVGSRYKIRFFEKTSGNLTAEPAFVLEGEGAPRDVIYISPSVGSATYPTGY